MYPTYELQVNTSEGWVQVEGSEASNRPHHYDVLRKEFSSLVRGAKPYIAHFVAEFGYRITCGPQPVDTWMAHEKEIAKERKAEQKNTDTAIQYSQPKGKNYLFKV